MQESMFSYGKSRNQQGRSQIYTLPNDVQIGLFQIAAMDEDEYTIYVKTPKNIREPLKKCLDQVMHKVFAGQWNGGPVKHKQSSKDFINWLGKNGWDSECIAKIELRGPYDPSRYNFGNSENKREPKHFKDSRLMGEQFRTILEGLERGIEPTDTHRAQMIEQIIGRVSEGQRGVARG